MEPNSPSSETQAGACVPVSHELRPRVVPSWVVVVPGDDAVTPFHRGRHLFALARPEDRTEAPHALQWWTLVHHEPQPAPSAHD